MAALTLVVAGIVSALTGAAFALVARGIHARPASPASRRARDAHALWWAALGTYLLLQGTLTIAAGADRLSLGAYLASRILAIPLLCASVWGITFFLAYLYTGRRGLALPLAIHYGAVGLLFAYVTFGQPQELRVSDWIVGLDDTTPLYRLVYVLVGLPPILASLAYFLLLPRVEDPAGRRRIVLVGGSILLYVGSGLAARLAAHDLLVFVALVVLGLGAAGASLAAYPPGGGAALSREGGR